jgi:hypothetical protein
MNFITLKSGAVINAAHIIHATQSEHAGQIAIVLTDEPTPWLESMSIEDFQNLLRGPAVTPIVSPIVNLDKLRHGEPCSFTYYGTVKHGVIEEIGYSDTLGDSFVKIASSDQVYTLWPSDGEVNRD